MRSFLLFIGPQTVSHTLSREEVKENMRGKLRDKRDTKHDRSKRELLMGRRPAKRGNRNLQLQQIDNDEDEDVLEEEGGLTITEEQQN